MSNDAGALMTLTIEQLEGETGIQVWRIRELIKEGKGPPHFRVGKVFRFRVKDVNAWLDEQTSSTKEG